MALQQNSFLTKGGAYGLGSTKFEVATKVVLPAAASGVVASIVLGISRAIGETMIVSLAAGSSPTASLNLTNSIQTMTVILLKLQPEMLHSVLICTIVFMQ